MLLFNIQPRNWEGVAEKHESWKQAFSERANAADCTQHRQDEGIRARRKERAQQRLHAGTRIISSASVSIL